jgi:TPP-dependent 2-oxoacid decarboxylase
MKKIIAIPFILLVLFSSCGNKKHKKHSAAKEMRIEIVPFYKNVVYIKDLHLIDTNMFLVEPEEFLSKEQFLKFTEAMWKVIRDPKSKAYGGSTVYNKAYTAEQLRERFVYCDSVVQVDENNNEIGKAFWACDSTFLMDGVSRITFYESWYLNTKTNLIEKETLGYSVWNYVKDKEAFREMFIIFRDPEAALKCEKFEFSD